MPVLNLRGSSPQFPVSEDTLRLAAGFFSIYVAVMVKISGASAPYTEQLPPDAPRITASVAAKITSPQTPLAAASVSRQLPALLASLGLPGDRLSASLITFARFFSLPMDSALLSAIRRQALQAAAESGASANAALPRPERESSGEASLAKTVADAFVLAALAAADKDAPVSTAALAEYAAALDPDGGGAGQGGEEPDKKRQQNNDKEPDAYDALETLTPSLLKEKLLHNTAQNPTLTLLNSLPSKNGRRWLVFPFRFTQDGADYHISLRILLDSSSPENRNGRVCLDIAQPARGLRRLVVVDSANGRPDRARLLLRPACPAKTLKAMSGALAAILEIPLERVSAENCGDFFPLVPDSGEPLPPVIDEAV